MRWFPVRQQILTAIAVLFLGGVLPSSSSSVAQEQTVLAPAAPIEGEDPETLKMLYEHWAKKPKVTQVSGIVVNNSNAPSPGARIVVNLDYGVRLEGTADAEGRFQFEIPDLHLAQIYGEAADGTLAGVSDQVVDRRDGKLEVTVVLLPAHEIRVTILDAAGAAAPDVCCGVFVGRTVIARGRSDDKGVAKFRIPELPAMAGRSARLDPYRSLILYAFSDSKGLGVEPILRAEVLPDDSHELRLTAPKPAKVQVTDRDGKPLGEIPVAAMGQSFAVPNRLIGDFGEGGGAPIRVSMSMIQAPFAADGRSIVKTDATGLVELKWYAPHTPSTEAARFLVGRTPNPTTVAAIHSDWPIAFTPIENESTEPTAKLVIYSPAVIRGRVTLPNGGPAAGIAIAPRTTAAAVGARGGAVTNDKGEFELAARVDDVDYFVKDTKWIADRIPTGELARRGAVNEIEVKLREGKRVQFKVTGGPEFRPLEGQVIAIAGGPNAESGFQHFLTTDAEGRAEAVLDRGLYSIDANTQGEAPLRTTPLKLLVKDQAKIEAAIHLDLQTPRTISLAVKKPDGLTPAVGAKVERLTGAYSSRSAFADRAEGMRGRASGEPFPRGFGGSRGAGPGARRGVIGGPGGELAPAGQPAPDTALSTDAKGAVWVKVAVDSDAWLLITGADNEIALVKVDVLTDFVNPILKPSVQVRGRLIDEATGEPIVGATILAQLDPAKVHGRSNNAGRGGFATLTSNRASTSALTNVKGEFELTSLIPEAPYVIYLDGAIALPAGLSDVELRASFGGSRRIRITAATAPSEGASEMGEIKAPKPAPPPRPRIPNDPNAQ